jgi:hypothetical protein
MAVVADAVAADVDPEAALRRAARAYRQAVVDQESRVRRESERPET